jgi:anthranilate synthase/aminodeoxychorismate synthase-like glutamine amidotransferase
MKIAFLDHRDSFTYNLVALIESALPNASVCIFSPDAKLEDINFFSPACIVIGPGPGSPQDYPLIPSVLKYFSHLPVLGICLGMQAINEYFEGRTIRSKVPTHGKIHFVKHNHSSVFAGIPVEFRCMRYHSLQIEPSSNVEVIAFVESVPMALKVKNKAIYGLQFHPESFGSEHGERLIKNILGGANDVS